MKQPDLITTDVNGASYTHLPTRDLAKDLQRVQRKWNGKLKAFQTPVLHAAAGYDTVLSRTIDHYQARMVELTDPAHILLITLFKPTKPMTHKFNAEIEGWARSGRHQHQVHINYVDPVEWGLA